MEIKIVEKENKGFALATKDGNRLGEMTYSITGTNLIIIDHTEVAESERGNGLGRKLLDAIVEMAREKGIKIMPLCPFAKNQFNTDKSLSDVLYT